MAATSVMPWRKSRPDLPDRKPPRPAGELLWVHAGTTERGLALCDLGQRMKMLRPDLAVMLTSANGLVLPASAGGCDLQAGPLPEDQAMEVRQFLDHWRPDLCLWSGGGLRRELLRHCSERGIPKLLVDIEAEEIPARKSRLLPDQSRRTLDEFDRILTPSDQAAEQLRRMGISSAKVTRASRLRISATPPNCHDDELTRMQADLGSRPVWLAAHCLPDEVPMLLKAHRKASRRLHRLLLILAVADYDALEDVRGQLQASGLRTADWEVGGEPADNTPVVLSCDDDLGLWYRLAPLSVLAGTFG
jgi:3-deoxy-D-manno-octulosonic-acid transferase